MDWRGHSFNERNRGCYEFLKIVSTFLETPWLFWSLSTRIACTEMHVTSLQMPRFLLSHSWGLAFFPCSLFTHVARCSEPLLFFCGPHPVMYASTDFRVLIKLTEARPITLSCGGEDWKKKLQPSIKVFSICPYTMSFRYNRYIYSALWFVLYSPSLNTVTCVYPLFSSCFDVLKKNIYIYTNQVNSISREAFSIRIGNF